MQGIMEYTPPSCSSYFSFQKRIIDVGLGYHNLSSLIHLVYRVRPHQKIVDHIYLRGIFDVGHYLLPAYKSILPWCAQGQYPFPYRWEAAIMIMAQVYTYSESHIENALGRIIVDFLEYNCQLTIQRLQPRSNPLRNISPFCHNSQGWKLLVKYQHRSWHVTSIQLGCLSKSFIIATHETSNLSHKPKHI